MSLCCDHSPGPRAQWSSTRLAFLTSSTCLNVARTLERRPYARTQPVRVLPRTRPHVTGCHWHYHPTGWEMVPSGRYLLEVRVRRHPLRSPHRPSGSPSGRYLLEVRVRRHPLRSPHRPSRQQKVLTSGQRRYGGASKIRGNARGLQWPKPRAPSPCCMATKSERISMVTC